MGGVSQPDTGHDETDRSILDAVAAVMASREETGVPIKAMVFYEYMDDAGERNLSWRSVNMLTWDRIGMAQTILLGEQAAYIDGYGEMG